MILARPERTIEKASDLTLQDVADGARMERLECVELGGALAEAVLEASGAPLAFLNRHPRQAIRDALLGRQDKRLQRNVDQATAIRHAPADKVLDLPRCRDGHRTAGRIEVADIHNSTRPSRCINALDNIATCVDAPFGAREIFKSGAARGRVLS